MVLLGELREAKDVTANNIVSVRIPVSAHYNNVRIISLFLFPIISVSDSLSSSLNVTIRHPVYSPHDNVSIRLPVFLPMLMSASDSLCLLPWHLH